ncbi:hypothetical protein V2W45_84965 [Cenococcum geophilum]
MVSDVVPTENRWGCTFPFRFSTDSGVEQLFFLYVTASVLVAELIAPALSSIPMTNGLWSPIILGAVIEGFSIVIALFIPETLHLRNAKPLEPSEMKEQRSMDMASQCSSKQEGYGFKAQMQRLRDMMQFLKRGINPTLVVFTFLVNRLGRQPTYLLLRYSWKRCHWTM